MKVSLIAITKELTTDKVRSPEEFIVKVARVSSGKTGEELYQTPERLLAYCIKNGHWSIFQTVNLTYEVETSRAIAAQILRHTSFAFQEFSQRYQDVRVFGDNVFEPIQLRKKGKTNRQSSGEEFDPRVKLPGMDYDYKPLASELIAKHLKASKDLYGQLVDAGVATECARMVLPMTTKTKLYVTGSVRSWIHFIQIRSDEHAQLEIQQISNEIKRIFIEHFPHISKALDWL